MRQAGKAYLLDIGYWWGLMLLPIVLDAIGLVLLIIPPGYWLGLVFVAVGIVFPITIPFISYAKLYQKYVNLTSRVRLTADIGHFFNFPPQNETPLAGGERYISTSIKLAIYADIDADTSDIALNMLGVHRKKKWQLWQRMPYKTTRLQSIPSVSEHGMTTYRKHISASQPQPFEDLIDFKWRGSVPNGYIDVWWEVALKLGKPNQTLRQTLQFQPFWTDSRPL